MNDDASQLELKLMELVGSFKQSERLYFDVFMKQNFASLH